MKLKKIIITLLFAGCLCKGSAQSVGGITTGAASYCDSVNSGFISLNGYIGQVMYWEMSENKGAGWVKLGNTTSTQSYNKLVKTTSYRAIVKNGSSVQDTSSVSTITVYIHGNPGQLSGGGIFCANSGNGILSVTGAPGNVAYWQYSVDGGNAWSTTTNTSSTLSYLSISRSTLYRAIVETPGTCPKDTTSSVSFVIHPQTMAGSISGADSLCYGSPGDTLRLTGNVGEITGWMSSSDNGTTWKPLATTGSFITYTTVTQNNLYRAFVKSGTCDMQTATATVSVYNVNPADAGTDATITRFEKTTLNGKGNGNASWSNTGSLSDPDSFNPVASPLNTTNYVLTVTDTHGCTTTDSVTINVIVPVPTAITPNGDGVNDYFEVDKIGQYPGNSLLVYNRWGTLVYRSSPYNNQWNGKNLHGSDLPDELYYYVLDYGNGEKAVTNYILIKR